MSTAKPGVPFSEIKDGVRSLDLILFRGKDAVSGAISAVEKVSTGESSAGNYTHAGLALWSDEIDVRLPEGRKLLIMESTMSGRLADGVPDIHGQAHLGVQLRDLSAVVEAYDAPAETRMAYLPMKNEVRAKAHMGQIAQGLAGQLKHALRIRAVGAQAHVSLNFFTHG